MGEYNISDLQNALIKADRAGNAQDAKSLADAIRQHPEYQAQTIQQEPAPQADAIEAEPERGFFSRVLSGAKEAFTGKKRTTPETESAGALWAMPEIKDESVTAAFASLFSGGEELAQIMKSEFPEMEVRKDDKGNVFFKSAIDGKEYTNKPGFSASDVPRVIANATAFSKAGRASGLGKKMLLAGATQAGIESIQKDIGGTFDPGEVKLAAQTELLGPVFDVAGKGVAKGVSAGSDLASRTIKATAPEAVEDVIKESGEFGLEEFGKRVKAASGARTQGARERAVREIAEQAAPDKELLDSAKLIGVEEFLQPDHLTTNQSFREISQAVKSLPGSKAKQIEREGLLEVAAKADELIKQIGGTDDLSGLDRTIRDQMTDTVEKMGAESEILYQELKERIDPKTKINSNNVLSFIDSRADELGGFSNLSPMEKMIYNKLKPKTKTIKETIEKTVDSFDDADFTFGSSIPQPTKKIVKEVQDKVIEELPNYALLDSVRKDLTAAKFARQGPFKDAQTGLIKKLESLLMEDQRLAAEGAGALDLFDSARKSVAVRKGIEDDMSALFGKRIDGSLITPLTTAFKKLPEGDVSRFVKLINAVPANMRKEVVASGLSVAFGKSGRNNTINFNNFSNWHKNLQRNKQAYSALMANLPSDSVKRIKALADVSEAINRTSKGYIATGRINAAKDILQGSDALITRIYNTAISSAKKGIVTEAITTPLGAPGAGFASALGNTIVEGRSNVMELADSLLASDKFIAALKAPPETKSQAIKSLTNTGQFRKFANAVKGDIKENPDAWVSNALQVARQTREDSEQ